MDGILVVDKPQGPTSHDVVSHVRRALRIKKVGHTGTLDPMATGVLPLVLGRATKLARYLSGNDKTYLATLRLGVTTRTLDAEGEVVERRPEAVAAVDAAAIEAALAPLRGAQMQVPPMYSAKKVDGKKLYQLARQGLEVAREAKPVQVHELVCTAHEGARLDVRVRCSAGTYVRVLAQDIGANLGCGAYLEALRRTEAGAFEVSHAVTLAALDADPTLARAHLVPWAMALGGLPRLAVPLGLGRMIAAGYQLSVADLRGLDAPSFGLDEALAVALDGGEVIAVARSELASVDIPGSRRDRRALKTERVLAAAP